MSTLTVTQEPRALRVLLLPLALAACLGEPASEDHAPRSLPQLCFHDTNAQWSECCEAGTPQLEGTPAADILLGSSVDECIIGLGAADVITASDGDDRVFAGAGNDTIDAGAGSNLVAGQNGSDEIDLTAGSAIDTNTVHAGLGNDTVYGGDAADHIRGEGGTDVLYGGANIDILHGGGGIDQLYGDEEPDQLHGGQGGDLLEGGDGADELRGNAGDDTLHGGHGGDLLVPGPGTDLVEGGDGNDIIEIYDPCEIGPGSIVDGGAGSDTLRVPLPLGDRMMAGLTVLGVEEVEVRGADPSWQSGAECASPEPAQWQHDVASDLRWRYASAYERRSNEWALGTVLVELDTDEVGHGNRSIILRSPDPTGGLAGTQLDLDIQESGVAFHELHIPGNTVSRTPVFRRFRKPVPVASSGPWGWVILDDFGGLTGWLQDGTGGWQVSGSEGNATIDPYGLPAANDQELDDYIVLQPAPVPTDMDVQAPNPGMPHTGHVGGEGRFCTANRDNWMVKLYENIQSINQMMQEPVGPGMLLDLQYAYCNVFETRNIYHESFISSYRVYPDTMVAAYCDGNPAEYEDEGITVKEKLESYANWPQNDPDGRVADYWGLHLIDCVDDDGHSYVFEGCGKNPLCYRDRVFVDAAHAGLHIPGSSVELGHLVGAGPFADPSAPPYMPWLGVVSSIQGIATYPETGTSCTGFYPEFEPGSCPGGGASVAVHAQPGASTYRTAAHEIAHNFGATHYDDPIPLPPNAPQGCTTAYSIMVGDVDLGPNDCRVTRFANESLAEMDDCLGDPLCPRELPAP